jgi:hypothetical protein
MREYGMKGMRRKREKDPHPLPSILLNSLPP